MTDERIAEARLWLTHFSPLDGPAGDRIRAVLVVALEALERQEAAPVTHDGVRDDVMEIAT